MPNVLAGVSEIDMSATVMGKRIAMPLLFSPTALQRLFHWQGERAVAATAQAFDTWFGISSLARSVSKKSARQSRRPSCSSSISIRTRG